MSSRRDRYRGPDAPTANSLVPAGSALIVDELDRVLMQRRTDSGNRALPGGAITVSGESTEVHFVDPAEFAGLPIHDTVRLRLHYHAERRDSPYLG